MNTLGIIGRPGFIENVKKSLNRMGDEFRVELSDIRDAPARLSGKRLESEVKTVLGINLLDVILQKRIDLFDKENAFRLLEVLKEELLRKGPRGSHFEDPHLFLNIQVDHSLQGIHIPASTRRDQDFRFFR